MDPSAVLAAYDQQIRGSRGPHADGVIRELSPQWAGVVHSDLDERTADPAIDAQIEWFGARTWEWKHYSHDRPADLADRLLARGFTAEPAEALLVAEIAGLDLRRPAGVTIVEVTDERGAATLVDIHDRVFGGHYSVNVLDHPETEVGVVAEIDGTPVSAARVEFNHGTEFASLWGGGTLPEWRGRGVFRALVAYRAELAAAKGFRYLQVDASADSRPILSRLGFVELATTTPFVHHG